MGGQPLDRQRLVRFVPLAGTSRRHLGPTHVRAYGYVLDPDTVRYVAFFLSSGPVGTDGLFLKQVVDGPVQLYERYAANTAQRGTAITRREWLVRRGDQPPVNTYWWKFETDAAAFFRGCPALQADLQAGRYQPRDLERIVRAYNACGTAPTSPRRTGEH
ncbi:hypothetical protein [Hymenobacter canadensis]|uniref:Uncharacterized protein n=1 Tax=Hymenobacter canadensis TaxID=2999067 RepID=A0ABY7LVM3_9BACT|nr:hypothetical protein [Hymenobacter canadensis]WBA43992.1 hypothetical protein O3303_20725 [Hymenobacter canadensis]